jgi:hypothetical protein
VTKREIDCDEVNGLKQDGYLSGLGTERESAPPASNVAPGPRTRREVLKSLRENPWSP